MSDKSPPPDQQSLGGPQALMLLGQIHGLVQGLKDGQDLQNRRMDGFDESLTGIDARLRTVEQRAAVAGALSGGAVAVGTALIVEGIKQWAVQKGIGQ